MKPIDQPRIAFTGWNPFQFLHFEKLSSRFPDATLVVEERKNAQGVFDLESLRSGGKKVVHYDRRRMGKLDGEFDIIVCQTPFAGIEEIRKSRIAMLQYGYAKEAHNFGPWRSLADVCLTFGDYASRKMEAFCPAVATGNPRYEDWSNPDFREAARKKYADRIDPSKKTILYAPTWGGLSSLNEFADAVQALSGDFNVILKLHHNSQLAGPAFMDSIRKKFGAICDTRDDIVELLGVADAMISDYSGAIFDAIYCKVPVILLNPSSGESAAASKSDRYSIERARREEIGVVVEAPAKLRKALEGSLGNPSKQIASVAELRAGLFVEAENASQLAEETLLKLANGEFRQNQIQGYIRKEIRASLRAKTELSAARTFGGFVRMVGDQIRKKLHLAPKPASAKNHKTETVKKRKSPKAAATGTKAKAPSKAEIDSPHVLRLPFDGDMPDLVKPSTAHENEADIRFIHVPHGPDAPPQTSLTLIARKDPQARACLVHLSKSGYYAYCTKEGCTRFVRSDLVASIWIKIKAGEYQMTPDEVVYSVTPPANGSKPARLLVVMSSVHASPNTASLHRYFMQNFPTIQKYIPPDTAVLRVGDMGGVLGAFYLNTVHRPDNVSAIQRLIASVCADLGVDRNLVVLYGGSKGGTGAFYHSFLGSYRCVSVDPIVADEHYIKNLKDFHFTAGGVFAENKETVFNRLVADHRNPSPSGAAPARHAVICSERSPQFPYITRILMEPLRREVAFFNSRNPEIKDHPDVAAKTINTTTMLLNMQLYGLDITPGVTDID